MSFLTSRRPTGEGTGKRVPFCRTTSSPTRCRRNLRLFVLFVPNVEDATKAKSRRKKSTHKANTISRVVAVTRQVFQTSLSGALTQQAMLVTHGGCVRTTQITFLTFHNAFTSDKTPSAAYALSCSGIERCDSCRKQCPLIWTWDSGCPDALQISICYRKWRVIMESLGAGVWNDSLNCRT